VGFPAPSSLLFPTTLWVSLHFLVVGQALWWVFSLFLGFRFFFLKSLQLGFSPFLGHRPSATGMLMVVELGCQLLMANCLISSFTSSPHPRSLLSFSLHGRALWTVFLTTDCRSPLAPLFFGPLPSALSYSPLLSGFLLPSTFASILCSATTSQLMDGSSPSFPSSFIFIFIFILLFRVLGLCLYFILSHFFYLFFLICNNYLRLLH
jgi:hypothetical protein